MEVKAKKRWLLVCLALFLVLSCTAFAHKWEQLPACSSVSTIGSTTDNITKITLREFPWNRDASEDSEYTEGISKESSEGENVSVYWNNIDAVCYLGIEGQYYATAEFDQPANENESALCQVPTHKVNWDANPAKYCNSSCVGVNVGKSTGLTCCGDDLFEDCGKAEGDYFCAKMTGDSWEWINTKDNSLARLGKVSSLDCAGIPFVTTGSQLLTCGFSDQVNANAGEDLPFNYTVTFKGKEVWFGSYPVNSTAQRIYLPGYRQVPPYYCYAYITVSVEQDLTFYNRSGDTPLVGTISGGVSGTFSGSQNYHVTAGTHYILWDYTDSNNEPKQPADCAKDIVTYIKTANAEMLVSGSGGGIANMAVGSNLTLSTVENAPGATMRINQRAHPKALHEDEARHTVYDPLIFVGNYTISSGLPYVSLSYVSTGNTNTTVMDTDVVASLVENRVPKNSMPSFEFISVQKSGNSHDFMCANDGTSFMIYECAGESTGFSTHGGVLVSGDSVDLIVNRDFDDASGTEVGGFEVKTNEATIANDAATAPRPPKALKLTSIRGNQYVDLTSNYFIPVSATRPYTYYVWLKGTEKIAVGLKYYGAQGNLLSSDWSLTNGFVTPGANWTRYLRKITTWPSGTKFVKVRIHALNTESNNDNTIGTVWINDLYLGKFYCTNLDTLKSDLDGTNQASCEVTGSGFKWTGTKCCGDPEPVDEFYNDPFTGQGNKGGCWNSTIVYGGEFAKTPAYSSSAITGDVINYNGTFLGCAIDETDKIDGNEGLLSIKESKTNSNLVQNMNFCTMLPDAKSGQQHYFCSFDALWKRATLDSGMLYLNGTPKMLNLSTIAWEDTNVKQQECCAEFDCWNGTACVANQQGTANPVSTRGYRCINGEWTLKVLKYTPDRTGSGFCEIPQQCLLNPYGNFSENNEPAKNPQCILNGQYKEDAYCELANNSGEWTTRTKMLALQMLDFAEKSSTNDFTLYCGDLQEALNFYSYETASLGISVPEYVGEDFTNAFCVLRYKDGVAFGTTVNKAIDSIDSFLKALDKSQHLCDSKIDNNHRFDLCSSGEKIWYDEDIEGVIYLPTGSLGTVNWWDAFVSFIRSPFERITTYTLELPTEYDFFNKTGMFSTIYVSKKGTKYLFAVMEEGQYDADVGFSRDYIALKYKGLDVDVCKLAKEYEGQVDCKYDTTTQEYLLVRAKHALDSTKTVLSAWRDLTAKLRVV